MPPAKSQVDPPSGKFGNIVYSRRNELFWGAQLLGGVVDLPDKARRDFTNVYGHIREHTWMS